MLTSALTLLSTKLNRPPVTGDRVDRRRLIDMLNRGLSGPLSLVSAAAGFGKTTLVSAWIEGLAEHRHPPTPSAWLSLDENDSDLVVFLRYLVAAIRTAFPESCADTLALLHAPQPVSQAPLVVALSNDIERLPTRCILVLDDYHVIHGAAVHDFLNEMLRHWPQRLHLVLISRNSPPLPLVKLRAKGLLIEIHSHDLRFTAEEAAAYIRRSVRMPVEQSMVATLQERTEGWIAGIHLAILSLRSVENPNRALPDLISADSGIADYLADEVLACQPPAIRSFLLKTSILNRFCAELCEVLIGSEFPGFDMRAHMDWLERADLFFIPLDNGRRWYRYHHLWQDLLQQRLLNEFGRAQVSVLHRRAAIWFASQRLVDEALQHALAAEDLDLTARLMEQNLCDALNRADRSTLDGWGRLLPEAFVARQPWLLVINGLAAGIAWQADRVGVLWRQAEALIDGGQPANDLELLHGNIAMLRGLDAYATNHHVQAVAYTREALALLPRAWAYARGSAKLFLGMSMQSLGQAAAAEKLFLDEYQALTEQADAHAMWLLFTVSFNALQDGRLAQARLTGEMLLHQATRDNFVVFTGWASYFLGLAHYLWNDLDTAAMYFGKIVEQPYVIYGLTARWGMMGMVLTHHARGENAAAWQMLERLSQFEVNEIGVELEETRALRALLFMKQGELESARRWTDTLGATVADRPLMGPLDTHVIRAGILLSRGAPADVAAALVIADTIQEIAERTHNTRFRIALLALLALLLDAQGRADAAYAALQQAIDLAQPGGAIRSFVDLGPAMQGLLNRLAQQGDAGGAIRRILTAFPVPHNKIESGGAESRIHAANGGLIEPLTRRELEVLALLRQRLSDKEISHRLGLSTVTVKRHTVNLYGKLGVNKRWDAVFKAEALQILPPS